MNLLERIAFNILFNTVLSFFVGITMAVVAMFVFRIKRPSFHLYLYSLPFLKIIYDVFRGVPPDSYVWTDLNYLALPTGYGRWLSLSLGWSNFAPIIAMRLAVGNKLKNEMAESVLYSVSVPDVLYSWALDHIGEYSITVVLGGVLLTSLVLIARRLISWVQFERSRFLDRKLVCKPIEIRKLAIRRIDIYVSPSYSGSPFTGGLLKPYICFPEGTYGMLTGEEREAVVAHEIGHIRHFDLQQSLMLSIMGDLFWFVPFYRLVSCEIDGLREIVADQYAAKSKVGHAVLAQAMIKIREINFSLPEPALYSAFAKNQSIFAKRIALILKQGNECRFASFQNLAHLIGGLVVTGAVLSANFGGNYEIEKPSARYQQVENLVKPRLGVE